MYIASNGIKTAVILRDTDATSPRDPKYQDNITKMVCWHNRYNLGDKHSHSSPHDFAEEMVNKYVSQKDVLAALVNGEFSDFHAVQDGPDGNYSVENLVGLIPSKARWERLDWSISKDTFEPIEGEATFDLVSDVLDNCYPAEMLQLCNKCGNVAIMPLYLYDHSGISISTSSFVGRAQHAQWDSGQVGYIYLDKETALKELGMPSDTIRLAMELSTAHPFPIFRNNGETPSDTMRRLNYIPVRAEDIVNKDICKVSQPDQKILSPEFEKEGILYKKGSKLYAVTGIAPGSLQVLPVATFNPEKILPLTEEKWVERAEQVMRADVTEYDNYLTDEIYGYQIFEGLEEQESCWGFNPGEASIEELMNDELSGWFGTKLDFEFHTGDHFDIDEYFEDNEFPELRKKIEKDIRDFIVCEDITSKVYPFGVSADDLLANANGLLTAIVDDLYERHAEYDTACLFAAIEGHAGVSRALQPKLTVEDLEPGRDYTAEEIMEVFSKKPSLNDMIAKASAKTDASADLTGKNAHQQR